MAFFTMLQLCYDLFSLALGTPLAVQPGTKRSHNAGKILDQVFLPIFSQVDHLDLSALHRQALLDVVEPKAGQTVFVLHHDQADGRIGQQLQQHRASVVHP
jgi:hypothetical protein